MIASMVIELAARTWLSCLLVQQAVNCTLPEATEPDRPATKMNHILELRTFAQSFSLYSEAGKTG